MSTDKSKGKIFGVPEESEEADPKSSIQTAIDLQMEEVEWFAEEDISYFDEWVCICTTQNLFIFK